MLRLQTGKNRRVVKVHFNTNNPFSEGMILFMLNYNVIKLVIVLPTSIAYTVILPFLNHTKKGFSGAFNAG